MESILTSIKKLLGITEEYEHFDVDIIMYINSAFSVLTQLGVGPEEGFRIEDAGAVWSDFLYDDPRLEMVRTYRGAPGRCSCRVSPGGSAGHGKAGLRAECAR